MYFTDVTFLVFFLPVCLATCYLVPGRVKKPAIALFSLLLYGFMDPVYLPVLLNVAIFNFLFGFLICRFGRDRRLRRGLDLAALSVDGLVFFFFYLVTASYNRIQETVSASGQARTFGVPIGLVFLLMSCVSYLVDVYQRKAPFLRNFWDYLTYLFFFPKLFAGPVCEYHAFRSQLKAPNFSVCAAADGIELFVFGFSKKMLLADNIGQLRMVVFAQNIDAMPLLTGWLGAFAVLFEIYFDATGYIDMARGLGKLLGFSLPINYHAPFSAVSVSDFFRRYQITVIHWMKRYLCSLSPGREKGWKIFRIWIASVAFALFVGGSKNAFFSAFYFFVILAFEELFLKKMLISWPKLFRIWLTVLLVMFGFLFYALDSVSDIFPYLLSMLGVGVRFADGNTLYLLSGYWAVILLCMLFGSGIVGRYWKKLCHRYAGVTAVVQPLLLLLLFGVSLAFSVSDSTGGFLCIHG